MDVRVVRVNNLWYSDARISHYRKYGFYEYGFENMYDNQTQFFEDIGSCKKQICLREKPGIVIFALEVGGEEAGAIIFERQEDPDANIAISWEVTIEVFDNFSGKGVAIKTLSMAINQFRSCCNEKIDAVVRRNNRNQARIEKTLESVGFRLCSIDCHGNRYWVYDNVNAV